MDLLRTLLGDDIMTIIKDFLYNDSWGYDEWYYLNEDWKSMKDPMNFAGICLDYNLSSWEWNRWCKPGCDMNCSLKYQIISQSVMQEFVPHFLRILRQDYLR